MFTAKTTGLWLSAACLAGLAGTGCATRPFAEIDAGASGGPIDDVIIDAAAPVDLHPVVNPDLSVPPFDLATAPPSGDWVCIGGNPQHTSTQAAARIRSPLAVQRSFAVNVIGSSVIAKGILFVPIHVGPSELAEIAAFDLEVGLKWSAATYFDHGVPFLAADGDYLYSAPYVEELFRQSDGIVVPAAFSPGGSGRRPPVPGGGGVYSTWGTGSNPNYIPGKTPYDEVTEEVPADHQDAGWFNQGTVIFHYPGAGIVAVDGTLGFASDTANTYAFDRYHWAKAPLWQAATPNADGGATPIVSGGNVYTTDGNNLFVLDEVTGKQLTVVPDARVVAVDGQTALVTTPSGALESLSTAQPRAVRWSMPAPCSPPVIAAAGRQVFVASPGQIAEVDEDTGQTRSTVSLSAPDTCAALELTNDHLVAITAGGIFVF